jgi:hypothetical protein
MSIEEKMQAEEVQDALARLLAGREPKAAWLARCLTLEGWRLRVADVAWDRRGIVIHGKPASDRFKESMLRLPGGLARALDGPKIQVCADTTPALDPRCQGQRARYRQ